MPFQSLSIYSHGERTYSLPEEVPSSLKFVKPPVDTDITLVIMAPTQIKHNNSGDDFQAAIKNALKPVDDILAAAGITGYQINIENKAQGLVSPRMTITIAREYSEAGLNAADALLALSKNEEIIRDIEKAAVKVLTEHNTPKKKEIKAKVSKSTNPWIAYCDERKGVTEHLGTGI